MSDGATQYPTGRRNRDSAILRRLMRNTASNFVGTAIGLTVGFLLTPFLLKQLGATTFGLWMLIGSLVSYGQMFDFGMSGAITKYVAELRVSGQIDKASRLISASRVLYACFGLLVAGIFAAVAPLIPTAFGVPESEHATAVNAVVLVGIWMGVSITSAGLMAVLAGLHRFDAINLLQIIGTVVSAIGMVVVVLLGSGILGLVLVNIFAMLVTRTLTIVMIKRLAPEFQIGWRGVDRAAMRTILSFSFSMFLSQLAKRLQTKTDLIVVGAVMSVGAVAPYAVAWRLGQIVRVLVMQFLKVLMPVASELHAEGDWDRLRSLYISSTRVALAIAIPVSCAFIGLAGPFLTIWVGAEYAQYSYLVTILVLAVIISLSQLPAVSILQGMARNRLVAFSALASGMVNLGLSIILGRQFGLIGVALGTLIPTSLECIGVVLPYAARLLGLTIRDVTRGIVVPTLLPAVPTLISLQLLKYSIDPRSLIEIIIVAGACVLVYIIGYLAVGASRTERAAYRNVAATTIRFAGMHLKRT